MGAVFVAARLAFGGACPTSERELINSNSGVWPYDRGVLQASE